ncbi:MAG: hypothetical protein KDB21_01905 [Acidimicrobiales bacterium]|nr:hypothetical protein [Acidimicrobiales bacterium]
MNEPLYVGTRKGLFTLTRGAAGWGVESVDFLGEPVTAVLPAPDGTVYAALGHGHFGAHVWRQSDGSWSEIAAPTYPPRPDDADDIEPVRQIPIPWRTELIWSLEAGHAPGELWCGTIPGGLFRSADGGESWELCRPLWDHDARRNWAGGGYDLPGIHSISIDPSAPGTVLVGVSCGGAWVTTDNGASWEVTTGMRADFMPPELADAPDGQDPHRLSRCAGSPDVVWNQHHCGCYRSTDGGRTWVEITERAPSVFGFAVAAHPTDPDTAWFVPAIKDELRVPVDGRLVVSRTTDGGRTFDVLSDGLPGDHAYHLVYRHALDVDASGEALAFGSTTGSLWWSGDRGDHFETISNDLPPINVVRFGS